MAAEIVFWSPHLCVCMCLHYTCKHTIVCEHTHTYERGWQREMEREGGRIREAVHGPGSKRLMPDHNIERLYSWEYTRGCVLERSLWLPQQV